MLNRLLTASALTVILASAAYADPNYSYIDQDGSANSASLTQSGIGTNRAGAATTRMLQDGDNNMIDIDQFGALTGNDNTIGTGSVDATLGVDQSGDRNAFTASQADRRNKIHQVQQTSGSSSTATNILTIDQDGSNNAIANVTQVHGGGAANTATITQIGQSILGMQRERVNARASQVTEHGIDASGAYQDGSGNSMTILQDGGNLIRVAIQEGTTNTMSLSQDGSDNAMTLVRQTGDLNTASVDQIGSDNFVRWVDQSGNLNEAEVTQNGVGNVVDLVSQSGGANNATLNFQGDDNGSSGFTSPLTSGLGLTQGASIQSNDGASTNLIAFNVIGDANLFAFEQDGTGNTINGTVGSTGNPSSGNEAAVLQSGDGNVASFSQNGGGTNIVAISQ